MKMEVLSVQNHIQGQFGVIGTSKVKDWTSPLTPPPPSPPPAPPLQQQQQQHHPLSQREHNISNNNNNNNNTTDSGVVSNQRELSVSGTGVENVDAAVESPDDSMDVVDGHPQAAATRTALNAVAGAGSSTTTSSSGTTAILPSSNADFIAGVDFDELTRSSAVQELSQRLQMELRSAKSRHLSCTEVTLPYDLTPRIAAEIIRMSEREPCGERACTIFIEFESEPNNVRRIASFKVDPNTVSIFELYLTLKQDKGGWTSLLPQFLKNLTRSHTIMISPQFTLTKNKLYSLDE